MMKNNSDYFTNKMFVRQFAPAFVSAIGLAIGDMADAIVVGNKMGVTGLAAISLALPVFMIINVLMHGLGIGGSIRFSTCLAKGEHEKATKGFHGIILTAVIISAVLAVIGNIFMPQLLMVLGTTARDGALYDASYEYIKIIITGMPLFFISYISNYYLRNADHEKLASIGFTAGNISDIVLNVVFVIIMDNGVAGAAYATLAGQVISLSIYLVGFFKKPGSLKLVPFMPALEGTFKCFRVGFSSSVQYLFSMVFILLANNALMRMSGSVGVAVFDVVQNASFLILYLYDGTAKASQPIISTYSGEHNDNGRRTTLALSIFWGSIVGAIAIVFIAVFPASVCHLFGITNIEAIELGKYALRVLCIGEAFAGISTLLETYYQASGQEKCSLTIAILRGAVVLIPATMVFSLCGQKGFWWLYPFTEIVSLAAFVVWRKFFSSKEKNFDSERVYTNIISNKNAELGPLIAQIEEFCEKWEATVKQSYFVTMTVEELCAAIISKGFNGADGYIQLTVIAHEDNQFDLHIRDSATSFNPFTLQTKRADSEEGVDMDAMGVFVIRKKAKSFYYRRYQGFNTLIVKI